MCGVGSDRPYFVDNRILLRRTISRMVLLLRVPFAGEIENRFTSDRGSNTARYILPLLPFLAFAVDASHGSGY